MPNAVVRVTSLLLGFALAPMMAFQVLQTSAVAQTASTSDASFKVIRSSLATTLESVRQPKREVDRTDSGSRNKEALTATSVAVRKPHLRQPLSVAALQGLRRNETDTSRLDSGQEALREEISTPSPEPGAPLSGVPQVEDQPIGSLTVNIQCKTGEVPSDLAAGKFASQASLPLDALAVRCWPRYLYRWEAPALYHGPLYFEEVNLERYGYAHSRNGIFQPAISGGRFVATIVALPYMTSLRPPWEHVYSLGHYRPGDCVPFQARLMELNAKAAAVQGVVANGLVLAIP